MNNDLSDPQRKILCRTQDVPVPTGPMNKTPGFSGNVPTPTGMGIIM
jgi:hypothetical protein